MIANEAQIITALQVLNGTITDGERAVIQQLHRFVESKVKNYVGYDPEQSEVTEYYPRDVLVGFVPGAARWDVNAAHTHARMELTSIGRRTLQLAKLPLRSISTLKVDENGRFGSGASAFPSGSEWTEGSDFWAEWDADGICRSGLLHASGSWPLEHGSVEIVYTAGYSRAELEGTDESVDASGILSAVVKSMIVAFQKWNAWKKNDRAGVGGPFASERAQDYSYTLSAQLQGQLSMIASLPSEALDDLEDYRHYGLMRT